MRAVSLAGQQILYPVPLISGSNVINRRLILAERVFDRFDGFLQAFSEGVTWLPAQQLSGFFGVGQQQAHFAFLGTDALLVGVHRNIWLIHDLEDQVQRVAYGLRLAGTY